MPEQFPGISMLADIASFGYCSRTLAGLRDEGRFTPPSLKGSLAFPATAGGVEWGGGAVDPTDQHLCRQQLAGRPDLQAAAARRLRQDQARDAAPSSKNSNGYFAMQGAPYGFTLQTFLNPAGHALLEAPLRHAVVL